MDVPGPAIGELVGYYRRKNGNRKQAVIAGLCGITERYLSLIETGKKTPSTDLLGRLAAELGVPVSALLDESVPVSGNTVPGTAGPSVAAALMGYGPPRSSPALSPAVLRERVEDAWRLWQDSRQRFTEADKVLPELVADVEHAARVHRAGNDAAARREVLRTAADLYGLLRSYCRRNGRLDLALMVADRAIRAAEDADDPIRIAAAQWNLGHVLLSQPGAADEAQEVALHAAEELRQAPAIDEAAAMRGALELVAVVADAMQRRWWDARRRLEDKAAPLADRAGEGNPMWTVFGPTNVGLHALSIEMLAGEAADGLHLADQVDTSVMPSRERRFTFGLEVARCYDLRREDAAVLVHLLDLEELAPEDLQRSLLARDMITGLQRRVRPTYQRQVTALAERLGFLP
ncbi:helix-turn-helix domain-containing protein [Streptomyces sp. MAR4 CNY-716]